MVKDMAKIAKIVRDKFVELTKLFGHHYENECYTVADPDDKLLLLYVVYFRQEVGKMSCSSKDVSTTATER